MKINLNAQLKTKSGQRVSINPSIDGNRFFMQIDLEKINKLLKDNSLSKANRLALQYQLKLAEIILENEKDEIDINFRISIQDDNIEDSELEELDI